MGTVDVSTSLFQPLEDAICYRYVPTLTGQTSSSPVVRTLLSLPTHIGRLHIVNPMEIVEWQFKASEF